MRNSGIDESPDFSQVHSFQPKEYPYHFSRVGKYGPGRHGLTGKGVFEIVLIGIRRKFDQYHAGFGSRKNLDG